jgi:hypothetical protein
MNARDERSVRNKGKALTMMPLIASTPRTQDQWRAFQQLHVRYRRSHDLWSAREWVHLQFLRWLVRTGQLVS